VIGPGMAMSLKRSQNWSGARAIISSASLPVEAVRTAKPRRVSTFLASCCIARSSSTTSTACCTTAAPPAVCSVGSVPSHSASGPDSLIQARGYSN
jgi:hypothetical protein